MILTIFVILLGLLIIVIAFKLGYRYILNNVFLKNNKISYEYLRKPICAVSKDNYYMNYGLWLDENDTLATANRNLIQFMSNLILKHLPAPTTGSNAKPRAILMLDVGCGYGTQDIEFLNLLKPQLDTLCIEAIDIAETQIEYANQNRADNNIPAKTLTYKVGDAMELATSYKKAQFDILVSVETAFHYNSRRNFFKSIPPLLNPAGLFVICDLVLTDTFAVTQTKFMTNLVLNFFIDCLHIPRVNLISEAEFKHELAEHFQIVDFHNTTDRTFKPYYTYFWHEYLRNTIVPTCFIDSINQLFIDCQPFTYVIAVCKPKA